MAQRRVFTTKTCLRVPFIARWPGHIAAKAENDALQSLVDLAPTFLAACNIAIPGAMQGVNQLPVWENQRENARDEVIAEFRHQPTRVHLRTLVTQRYKMTIYRDQDYGELFDLHDDPDGTRQPVGRRGCIGCQSRNVPKVGLRRNAPRTDAAQSDRGRVRIGASELVPANPFAAGRLKPEVRLRGQNAIASPCGDARRNASQPRMDSLAATPKKRASSAIASA